MFGKKVILLAAPILAMSLWGCSSNFDAENNPTPGGTGTPVVDSASIGAGNCIGCHRDLDLLLSTTVVDDYLLGKHVIHSPDIDATSGDCLTCHDPIGDGPSLEDLIPPANYVDPSDGIPLAGLAAVTCEACHGGGGDHANGVPIPYETPDYDRCGQCHNGTYSPTITEHSVLATPEEGDNIIEDYSASKHFSGTVRNLAICVKCHTDEGARLDKSKDTAADLANTLPVTEANKIQCRTCHNAHNNGRLLEADTLTDPDPTLQASAEYNTCTNCHQQHDAKIGASITQVGTSTDGASGELIFHAGNWDRVISSTHWDDPATSYQQALADAGGVSSAVDQTTVLVEGYAIDPTNPRACRDCHNVHGADATINKQWAKSGHGGHIRDAKEVAAALPAASPIDQVAAVRAAGANGAGSALPHYDWDATYKTDGTDLDTLPDLDRGECQMCHTATGVKNFLTDPVNYDFNNNDFSHLAGWVAQTATVPTVSSGQNELIYCWGCHSNNSGALRNPGAITLSYTVDAVKPTLPDLGKTNVCVNCHAGRGNMDTYNLASIPDISLLRPGFGLNTKNVTASHYFNAAATIYQAQTRVGYQYAGLSYSDRTFYAHKGLGLNNNSPETGSGPCAVCHMEAANHTLDVVEKDIAGVITELKADICVTCHDGEHALFVSQGLVGTTQNIWNGDAAVPTVVTQTMADDTVAELEHEAEGFHEALTRLEQELSTDGLTFSINYPYFSGLSWVDEGTFGAAHNFNYLHHEPGAWAHNRYYAKRLIFDSIDWLDGDNWDTTGATPVRGVADGNNLDGIINIDIVALPAAAPWLGASSVDNPTARPWLLIGDAIRP